MNASITADPDVVTVEVATMVGTWRPSPSEITDVQEQLIARHSRLGLEPVISSEEVVEGFFRCRLVDYLARRFDVGTEELPGCVNSSHRAVRQVCVAPNEHRHLSISDRVWSNAWTEMQAAFPAVNIRTPGHRSSRHADLHIVATQQIVSLEFKYVARKSLRCVDACIEQMRRHAENHARALFVVYCSSGAVPDLRRVAASLLCNASIVAAGGPPIAPVDRRAA